MAYKVRLTSTAKADALAAFEYIRDLDPDSAEQWLHRLFDAIASLAEMPGRCPLISEAGDFGLPIRHLIFGKRTGTYRIIFDVQEQSEEGPQVRVLRIWHGARDRILPDDIAGE